MLDFMLCLLRAMGIKGVPTILTHMLSNRVNSDDEYNRVTKWHLEKWNKKEDLKSSLR